MTALDAVVTVVAAFVVPLWIAQRINDRLNRAEQARSQEAVRRALRADEGTPADWIAYVKGRGPHPRQ